MLRLRRNIKRIETGALPEAFRSVACGGKEGKHGSCCFRLCRKQHDPCSSCILGEIGQDVLSGLEFEGDFGEGRP